MAVINQGEISGKGLSKKHLGYPAIFSVALFLFSDLKEVRQWMWRKILLFLARSTDPDKLSSDILKGNFSLVVP